MLLDLVLRHPGLPLGEAAAVPHALGRQEGHEVPGGVGGQEAVLAEQEGAPDVAAGITRLLKKKEEERENKNCTWLMHTPCPTNKTLLINFLLSSDAEIFVNKHRLSIRIGVERAETCTQRAHVPTEPPLCTPPLVVWVCAHPPRSRSCRRRPCPCRRVPWRRRRWRPGPT